MFKEGWRKVSDKIHGDGFPWPRRNKETLVEAKFIIGELGVAIRSTLMDKVIYILHMDGNKNSIANDEDFSK
jgi:hypothetical protein